MFQVSKQDPGQGFKLQFPSFKCQTKIQVRVSSCNFQDSSFKPGSRSGFQVAISNFQVSNQDPGQGFKLPFASSFKPRSRSGRPVAISKLRVSNQDPGRGFKLQFPSFKIQSKFRVRVSSCNFLVTRFKQRSRSGLQVAISKFQDPHQDPGQCPKLLLPSFKIQTKVQVRVPSCNFQGSRFTPRARSGFDKHVLEGRRLFLWKQGLHVLITRCFYLSGSRSYHPSPPPIFNPSPPQHLLEDLYLG